MFIRLPKVCQQKSPAKRDFFYIYSELGLGVLVKARWDYRKTANFQRMIPERQANVRDIPIGHL